MRLLTLHSILAATDLEPTSAPALRAASRLAALAEAQLHLLHVGDTGVADADTRLTEQYRQTTKDEPLPASARTMTGPPAARIVEQARSIEADVVIFGRHRGGDDDRPLGSTAASVVRTAHCPCLAVSTELQLPLERVLVATDLSETAGDALSVALTWASALRPRGREALLTALHVTSDATTAAAEAAVRAQVEAARALAGSPAHVEIRYLVLTGDQTAARILETAAAMPADLLVMATRGPDGAPSKLGGVSEAVTRSAPCPLLLVPPATLAAYRGV